MKRFLFSVVIATSLALTSCQFDDSALWSKLDEYGETIKDHEQRISALEELCKQMNTNISSLQTIVEALQNNDYVTAVVPVVKDGVTIGYTITFSKSQPVTIYHGEDGQDGANGTNGKDGYTPQIGIKQDTDNIYYWTLDGEWLLDAKGNKIKAVGVDGEDGKDGTNGTDGKDGQDGTNGTDGKDGVDGTNGANGQDGKDGADGVTPQLKIENDYWYVSYDNGATWVQLGKATGEDGKDGQDGNDGADGENGKDGDSFFQSVTQDEECVYLTLADGTIITLPKYNEPIEKVNNKIYYTTTDDKKMFPASTSPAPFGAILISNTYEDGQGVLTFDDTVTSIGNSAFIGCTRLKTITLEEGVEVIGNQAFESCTSLTSITIPDGVTSIGGYAFYNCKSLTSVTIPDSVTSIGLECFVDCTSLEKITIPGSITSIYRNMFDRCISLSEVVINNGVTYIGEYAFSGCTSLTDITIPDSVTKIDNYAFWDCTALLSITIGSGVTYIGEHVFWGCDSLGAFYGKFASADNRCLIVDGVLRYFAHIGLTKYTIPDNVVSIQSGVFADNSLLKSITIPDSVTSIGENAFAGCLGLTSVVIPENVIFIGGRAFFECTSLRNVYCNPTIPPTTSDQIFCFHTANGVQPIGCKIYVPTASVDTYKQHNSWRSYTDYIEGYEF